MIRPVTTSGTYALVGTAFGVVHPISPRDTCDCKENRGTFKVKNGMAQPNIGVEWLQRTATDEIPTPSTTARSSTLASKPESAPSRTQATSRAAHSSSAAVSSTVNVFSNFTGPPLATTSSATPAYHTDLLANASENERRHWTGRPPSYPTDAPAQSPRHDDKSTYALTQNASYSLPLATSWDSHKVSLTYIGKGEDAPNYNVPNLFLAKDNSSFYSFNGDVGGENKVDVPNATAELWSFTPDNTGVGSWQLFSVAPPSIIGSVWTGCTTGNGWVYLLGGTHSFATALNLAQLGTSDAQSANGLVSYNMDTRTWLNQSMEYPYPNGWGWN
ncbi:MAG: hypothetical protein Q9170_007207 [Blastenia crenularia]